MDYFVNTALTTLKGEPMLVDSGKGQVPFTYASVFIEALLRPEAEGDPRNPQASKLTGKDKLQRWELAQRLYKAEQDAQPVQFTTEEIVLLKTLVNQCFPAMVVGQVYTWLK